MRKRQRKKALKSLREVKVKKLRLVTKKLQAQMRTAGEVTLINLYGSKDGSFTK